MRPSILSTLWVFIFCLLFTPAFAQQNVGIGTLTPNGKAILDMESTTMGLLIPRMTSPERVAIFPSGLTDEGLMVYDNTLNQFYYWDGTQWLPFGGGGADGDWTVTGTDMFSAVSGNVGIGVSLPAAKFHTNGSLKFENVVPGVSNFILVVDGAGDVGQRFLPANVWDGDDVNDADASTTNELNTAFSYNPGTQQLSITDAGGTLTATINVTATADLDSDTTNELQTLTSLYDGTAEEVTVSISNGNSTTFSIEDGDSDDSNELQTLTLVQTGDSVNWNLSDGGGNGSFSLTDADWAGAGTGVMYPVTLTDNIGISRNTAFYDLDVNGDIRVVDQLIFDTTGYFIERNANNLYFSSTNDFRFVSGQGHNIRYYAQAGEAIVNYRLDNEDVMTLRGDDGGGANQFNVGIGNTAPVSKLHVAGDIRLGAINPPGFTNGGSNYGDLLYLSGAPGYNAPANLDSENSDPLFISRYNSGPDLSEIRINIGDNTSGDNTLRDRLSIGALATGSTNLNDYQSLFQFEINNSSTDSDEPMLSISPVGVLHSTNYHGALSLTKPDTSNGQYINLVREGAGADWSIGYQYTSNNFAIGQSTTNNSAFTNPEFTILASTGYVGLGVNNPSYRVTLPNSPSTAGRGIAEMWVTYSDGRFKTDRTELPPVLDKVMQLLPLNYHWEDFDHDENGQLVGLGTVNPYTDLGFIAQDVYELFPEVVSKPENEATATWGIDYARLSVVLTKALQEQQMMLTAEKQQHQQTQMEVAALQTQMQRVLDRLASLEGKTGTTTASK